MTDDADARKSSEDAKQDAEIAQLEAEVAALESEEQGETPSPAPVAPAPPTPPAPIGDVVALVNESTLVEDAEIAGWANALEAQAGHVDSHWETGAVKVLGPMSIRDVPAGAYPLVILDNSDAAGALGYHDVDPHGRPYGRVFAHDCLANGVSVSSCASHEFVEIIGDPPCTLWEGGPGGMLYARELGDPVEASSYELDGVEVSDFVTPAYFGLAHPDTPITAENAAKVAISHGGIVDAPFTVQPGGYQITRDQNGNVSQVYGESYPEWRKPGKNWPGCRTARRSR